MNRFLFLFFLCAALSSDIFAADKSDAAKPPTITASEPKSPAPKNKAGDRKLESAITAVENKAGFTQITLQNGELRLGLNTETEVVREERGVVASDLKVGDALALIALKGQRSKLKITQPAVVTAINPLTIEIGDSAKMTLLKADEWEFFRITPIKPEELKIGQTVALQLSLKVDGDIATKRVAVLIGKPFPTKTKPKPKVKPPTTGNN